MANEGRGEVLGQFVATYADGTQHFYLIETAGGSGYLSGYDRTGASVRQRMDADMVKSRQALETGVYRFAPNGIVDLIFEPASKMKGVVVDDPVTDRPLH